MCHWISAEQATAYAHLTTSAIAAALDSVTVPDAIEGSVDGLHAAGMLFAGQPAALAVVQRTPGSDISLVSLAVADPFRRLGLGRQLVHWLVAEAARLECSGLMVSYPLNHRSTAAMERLTDPGEGWQHSPGLRLIHFDRAAGTSIVTRLAPLVARWQREQRWSVSPWRVQQPEQLLQIKTLQQQAPQWAWPHLEEVEAQLGQRDASISQVLFDRDQVAGWLIAHRIGLSLCRVTQWWVQPELQGRGVALLLLHHAIANALTAQPKYVSGCFGVASQSQSMRVMSARFLEPLASSVQENQRARIRFQ